MVLFDGGGPTGCEVSVGGGVGRVGGVWRGKVETGGEGGDGLVEGGDGAVRIEGEVAENGEGGGGLFGGGLGDGGFACTGWKRGGGGQVAEDEVAVGGEGRDLGEFALFEGGAETGANLFVEEALELLGDLDGGGRVQVSGDFQRGGG